MTSRDQACARFALDVVERHRGQDGADRFRKAVESLPGLLRTCGLGQTAAYLKGKGDPGGGERALYGILQNWLCENSPPILGAGDLMDVVMRSSRDAYMKATESAWQLCEWLKPLAVAYLPESTGGPADAPRRP